MKTNGPQNGADILHDLYICTEVYGYARDT